MDRNSVRSIDQDGRMHVAVSHISKAGVNPYYGRDIPKAEELGLDLNKIYYMLRDPDELAKGAASFNNLQILAKHVPVNAEEPQNDITVGSTGTDAVFNAPYLDNSLVFWDSKAIAGVESGQLCELSAAYHYDADMRPGIYQGAKYDGVMRNIRGNHVAQVEEGRAGRDVTVMDAALNNTLNKVVKSFVALRKVQVGKRLERSMKTQQMAKRKGALLNTTAMAHGIRLGRKLAMDASATTLLQLLDGLEDKGHPDPGAEKGTMGPTGVGRPEGGATPDVNLPTEEFGDPEGTNKPALGEDDDTENKVRELLAGKLDDADLEMLLKLIRPEGENDVAPPDAEAPPPDDAPPAPAQSSDPKGEETPSELDDTNEDEMPQALEANTNTGGNKIAPNPTGAKAGNFGGSPGMKPAMDAAIKLAVDKAVKQTTERLNAIRKAEADVRPYVGNIIVAMDSADAIYKFALEQSGVDVKDVHPSAYPAMLKMVTKPGDAPPRQHRTLAQDAAVQDSLNKRFPNIGRVRVVG